MQELLTSGGETVIRPWVAAVGVARDGHPGAGGWEGRVDADWEFGGFGVLGRGRRRG